MITLRSRILVLTSLCALAVACSSDDGTTTPPSIEPSNDAMADTAADGAGTDPTDAGGLDTSSTDVAEPDVSAPDTRTPTEVSLVAGQSTLRVRESSGLITLAHGDAVRITLPLDAFTLGVVPALEATRAYDPYFFEPGIEFLELYFPPPILEWVTPVSMSVSEATDATIRIDLLYPGGRTGTVAFERVGDERISAHWTAGDGDPAAYFRLNVKADPTEGFYGLGEVFDHPEHRGRVRAMQFEITTLESAYNEVHVPVPFLTGTTGWGIFVECMRMGVFSPGVHADDDVRVSFGLGETWKDGLQFFLYTADHPLDVTKKYYETTGFPGLPAPWAYGPLYWRDEVSGQVQVEADFQTLRDLDLAATGYWIDRPYASGVNAFDFDPTKYTDDAAMVAAGHAAGLRLALWHTPYLDKDDEDTLELWQEATDAGYYPPTAGAASKWGPSIDFTNADAVGWWQTQLDYYVNLGFEGYKLDFAEEVIASAFDARVPWLFSDGSDEMTMHRRHQYLYHQAYRATVPDEGGLMLVRAGMYGDQVHGVIVWPGDIDATLLKHFEPGVTTDGDAYVSVGGVPAAVAAGQSLGVSGYPFFGSDTGGYRNSPPSKETYIRWFQHTAFSTCMQVGTNSNDLPWSFGPDKVEDQEIVSLFRRYARWHLRLFPMVWSYATTIADNGHAIQRPLGFAHPELGVHPPDTYLLGHDLLVAPVLEPGATTREVHFPAGEWTDFWTGEIVSGGQAHTVDAPLDTIPVFLRAGAIVPALRPTIDTINPIGPGANIDSLADNAGRLWILVTPGSEERTLVNYDGTEITVSPTCVNGQNGLSVSAVMGDVFSGVVVDIRAALPEPPEVTSAGESLAQLDALSEAGSGWILNEDKPGARIKPAAGNASVNIALPGRCE